MSVRCARVISAEHDLQFFFVSSVCVVYFVLSFVTPNPPDGFPSFETHQLECLF